MNRAVRRGLALCLFVAVAVVSVCGQSVEALMNSGQDLLRNGAYGQAIAAFRKALSQDPSQFEAQHNIAFCYLQMGRTTDAIREFRRAIEMNGRNAETWANLAVAYEQDGKSDKALEALSNSVNLDANNVTARMNLATMYANSDRYPQAIAQFKQVVAQDGRNVDAYTNLAKCLINTKAYVDAEKYLREALGVDPGSGELHYQLGNVMMAKDKNRDKAIAEYRTAITLQPTEALYYQDLANVLLDAGKKPEAIEVLKNSLVHSEDALVKEKIEKRIEQLEGGAAADVKGGSSAPKVDMGMQDLRNDMRPDEERKGTRVLKTGPVDVSGDFDDLEDKSKDLDLTKEAKKRAKDDKKSK